MSNLLHSPFKFLVKDLLTVLNDEDLASLVKTVSSGRIAPENKEGKFLIKDALQHKS